MVECAQILYRRQVAWVNKNALPRVYPKPPPIDRGPKFSNTGRMEELSIPMHKYIKPENDPTCWVYLLLHPVKESAKNYVASAAIDSLAEPRWGRPPLKKQTAWHSKPYRQYTNGPWSERIEKLSQPKIPYKKIEPPPPVSPKAMQYNASERITKLAEPCMRKVELNEFAFTVNPIALKYFPSARTRKMARPHHVMTAAELAEQEARHERHKYKYDKERARKLAAKREATAERHQKERKSLGI